MAVVAVVLAMQAVKAVPLQYVVICFLPAAGLLLVHSVISVIKLLASLPA